LQTLLPPTIVAAIDWSSLALVPASEVDRDLGQHHADLLYTCLLAGRRVYLHILFEHRSHGGGCLPLDLLRYETRIWEHQMRTDGRLSPILPVVVFHGEAGWQGPADFAHLFDHADLPAELRAALAPFVPDFRFVVDDLTQVSPGALRARAATGLARLTLLCLQRIRDAKDPYAEVEHLHDLLRDVRAARHGHDAVLAVLRYVYAVADTSPERMHDALRLAGPDIQKTMTTLEERLLAKGEAKGEARGEARGETKGRIQTLRVQLEARFGPLPADALARLTQGTPEDHDRWTRLVLTAPTLRDALA
jgi:predicted transposase YdaD